MVMQFIKKIIFKLLGLTFVDDISKVDISSHTVVLVKLSRPVNDYHNLHAKLKQVFPNNMILFYSDDVGYEFIERKDDTLN